MIFKMYQFKGFVPVKVYLMSKRKKEKMAEFWKTANIGKNLVLPKKNLSITYFDILFTLRKQKYIITK